MSKYERIFDLKSRWLKDPTFDIVNEPGFEEHRDELLEFRERVEGRWRSRSNELGVSVNHARYLESLEEKVEELEEKIQEEAEARDKVEERLENLIERLENRFDELEASIEDLADV